MKSILWLRFETFNTGICIKRPCRKGSQRMNTQILADGMNVSSQGWTQQLHACA